MTGCCIIITTTDKEKVAENIATTLVEQGFAKCVWNDNVKSTYMWEGKLTHDIEYRIMIKSAISNADKIIEEIKSMHNYSLPGIVQLNIDSGNENYLSWLRMGK